MKLHPIFKIREQATKEIVQLLDSVTLGTNGAHYRHLDTEEKISEADNPLFLSLERHEKVLGNITFCRRGKDWYVRYFAFDTMVQSAGKKKSGANKSGLLKTELTKFFSTALKEGYKDSQVDSFYAYIDPNNEKSLWMSENFGFRKVAEIATQTYSRAHPKESNRLVKIDKWTDVKDVVQEHFKDYNYYNDVHIQKPPFYLLKDERGEILAFATISHANWEIKRLPGKFGGLLTKLIPYIPRIRKLIHPKEHSFIVPEAILVKDNHSELLSELLEGILAAEDKNLIIWWTDTNEPLYQDVKGQVKWGLLHKVIGVSNAHLVVKDTTERVVERNQKPFYTIGFDFI